MPKLAAESIPVVLRKGNIAQAPSGVLFLGDGWEFDRSNVTNPAAHQDLIDYLAEQYPETVFRPPAFQDWE